MTAIAAFEGSFAARKSCPLSFLIGVNFDTVCSAHLCLFEPRFFGLSQVDIGPLYISQLLLRLRGAPKCDVRKFSKPK
jgi:hypothetical protein